MDNEKEAVIQKLTVAAFSINGKIRPALVPPGGVQLAFARKGARDHTGIARVRDGIQATIQTPDQLEAVFGGEGMIVTDLLTAMRFDPRIRSAGIIACTRSAITTMEARFLEICSFDERKEPPGIKTMNWGVAQCCRDGVPDAIYNRSTGNTAGLIRLFGEDPSEVANNILMLLV